MRRLFLFVVLLSLPLSCHGCNEPRPTEPDKPVRVYDVSWLRLTHDHTTASAYTGQRVRITLRPGEYVVSGDELRVWANDRRVPPILICRCDVLPPLSEPATLVVVGVCQAPIRDGVHRTLLADYYIVVNQCVVTAR